MQGQDIYDNISNWDFLWSKQREASEPATVAIDIGLEIEPRQQNPQQKGQQKGETKKNDEKEEKTFGYGWVMACSMRMGKTLCRQDLVTDCMSWWKYDLTSQIKKDSIFPKKIIQSFKKFFC